MRNSIRIRHCVRAWRLSWYFVLTALIGFQAYSKPLVFSLSDEEREQLKYQKIMEIQSRQVMTLDLDPSSTNLLTEQTFVQWQNSWLDVWCETFWYDDSYLYYLVSYMDAISNSFTDPYYLEGSFPYLSLQNQQSLLLANSVFANTTSNQLNTVISKLNNLTSDDGNLKVNFDSLKQELVEIKDDVDISRQTLSDIKLDSSNISANSDILKNTNIAILNQTQSINTNLIMVSNMTSNQVQRVISKLDKLTGDDGSGNQNINVNLQPLQQPLDNIKNELINSNDHLDRISNTLKPDIQSAVDDINTYTQKIETNQIEMNANVVEGFEESNTLLDHIDSDLHDMKTDLGDLLIQFGDGGSINGDTIKNLSESIANELNLKIAPILTNDTQKIVDSIDQKFEIASSDMSQVGVAETAGNYLNSEMRLATDQLRSELQGLQYTNINAVVYDYDDYSNYYTLSGYADNPPSNDAFIRQKVQDYIDAVNYVTENVKGQITTRLDELKQSTLLTTSYDPEWLVVKAGGLYSKGGNQFPDVDWSVDFSKIKLDSDIAKSIYDWIYYIMACLIIYRQFRKVVD